MSRMYVGIAVLLVGCGGPQDPRTEDLTADEHEDEAAREEQAAAEHRDDYQPVFFGPDQYNPLETHLIEADTHREHAQAHRERAAELRAYEEQQCAEFPPASRAACPLLLGLSNVEDVEGGSRLTFVSGADLEPIVEHIRCHLAFAAAQGREGIEHCALYVPGARLAVEESAVLLTTDRAEFVEDLRARVALQALPVQ